MILRAKIIFIFLEKIYNQKITTLDHILKLLFTPQSPLLIKINLLDIYFRGWLFIKIIDNLNYSYNYYDIMMLVLLGFKILELLRIS